MTDPTTAINDGPKPFYRRWWFIALAVVFVLGAIGSTADDEGPESAVVAADNSTTSTTSVEMTTTTSTSTTTTPPTTTAAVTTTTTTEVVLTQEDKNALFGFVFDSQRIEVASLLEEGIFHIESVDVIRYDPEEGTIHLAMTSAFPSLLPGDLPVDGWDIMQAWKAYFSSFLENADTDFGVDVVPNISVDLSGHSFACPSDFVLDMVDLRASQADFERICIGH
jgi:hypothetical protein